VILAALLGIFLLGLQSAPAVKLADGFDPASAGLAAADIDGDGHPEIIAWSANGVKVFKKGSATPLDCGLGAMEDVISIAPGGLTDLAILTKSGAEIWANHAGKFEKLDVLTPEGEYKKAVWADYDHDGDLDLFLLGDKSVLLRNDGAAGFTDVHNNFPFIAGRAVDGVALGTDLVVIYSDRPGVLYADELGGRYEAQDLNMIPAGAKSIAAAGLDLIVTTDSGTFRFLNRHGSFERGAPITKSSPALDAAVQIAVDFDGDGRTDLVAIQRDGSLVFLPAH
jgi:hypothetical protein